MYVLVHRAFASMPRAPGRLLASWQVKPEPYLRSAAAADSEQKQQSTRVGTYVPFVRVTFLLPPRVDRGLTLLLMASRAAAFSKGMSSQLSDFLRNGFVLIRKDRQTSLLDVQKLNEHVVDYSRKIQSSFKYKFWRFFNSVDSSSNRHSIPLHTDVSPLLLPVLGSSVSTVTRFLQTQFRHHSAPLVELSALISYPGSRNQVVHSDIKYSSRETSHILSGFIALCDVTLEKGPTYLYASTHVQKFHERRVRALRSKNVSYSADGTAETDEDVFVSLEMKDEAPSACDDSEEVASRSPVYALLNAGDILIFDTKLFHFGGANTSQSPRALLCFAFQDLGARGEDAGRIEGFTYHCDDSIVSMKTTLKSFEKIE